MAFLEVQRDLGHIKVGRKQLVKFYYKDIREIKKTTVSCDCLTPVNEARFNRLVVEWEPKPIPIHLKDKGQYTTQKTITVTYTTADQPYLDQVAVLVFSAIVQN